MEDIKREVNRGKAVSSLASNIVNCAQLSLHAKQLQLEYGIEENIVPSLNYEAD